MPDVQSIKARFEIETNSPCPHDMFFAPPYFSNEAELGIKTMCTPCPSAFAYVHAVWARRSLQDDNSYDGLCQHMLAGLTPRIHPYTQMHSRDPILISQILFSCAPRGLRTSGPRSEVNCTMGPCSVMNT